MPLHWTGVFTLSTRVECKLHVSDATGDLFLIRLVVYPIPISGSCDNELSGQILRNQKFTRKVVNLLRAVIKHKWGAQNIKVVRTVMQTLCYVERKYRYKRIVSKKVCYKRRTAHKIMT